MLELVLNASEIIDNLLIVYVQRDILIYLCLKLLPLMIVLDVPILNAKPARLMPELVLNALDLIDNLQIVLVH